MAVNKDETELLIQELQLNPARFKLASALSLAVRVDQPFLRHTRLSLYPQDNASAEIEIWFGPLVERFSGTGFVFHPLVAESLRAELKKDVELLDKVWAILKEAHAHLSPAIQLEEEVTWMALRGCPEHAMRKKLGKVLKALHEPGREALASWAMRAIPRLPDNAREISTASQINYVGQVLAQGGILSGISNQPSFDWKNFVKHGDKRVKVSVIIRGNDVILSGKSTTDRNARHLEIPYTDPQVFQASWEEDGRTSSKLFLLDEDSSAEIHNVGSNLTLQFPNGSSYRILVPEIFYVSNVEELFTLIGSNRIIYLEPKEYLLSAVKKRKDKFSKFLKIEREYDGNVITICNIKNFWIVGSSQEVSRLIVSPQYVHVLKFEECENINLINLTMGHGAKKGYCLGGVLGFSDSSRCHIENGDFFGCGTNGLELTNISLFSMKNSKIRDCTYGIMRLKKCREIKFSNCEFFNNKEHYGFILNDSKDVSFGDCQVVKNLISGGAPLFNIASSSNIRMVRGTVQKNSAAGLVNEGHLLALEGVNILDNRFDSTRPGLKPVEILKSLPEPTLEVVLPPNLNHVYFDQASPHPFRSRAVRFQLVNAWWLAEASLLAYADGDFARAQFQRAGFSVPDSQPFSDAKHGTQCYVAHNDKAVIVVFRGTEVRKPGIGQEPAEAWREIVKDWKSDAQFQLIPWEHGGSVHRGFREAFATLWTQEVEPYLRELVGDEKKRAVWFTGHSLGAALATLAADSYRGAQGLYTYGSPLVGDEAFASDFHVSAYRLVNNNDIVARVPPWGPYGSNLKWGSYEHVGLFKYLDEDGDLHDNPSFWKRVKHGVQGGFEHFGDVARHWSQGDFENFPIEFLNDHAPLYYALRIWNCYDRVLQGLQDL